MKKLYTHLAFPLFALAVLFSTACKDDETNDVLPDESLMTSDSVDVDLPLSNGSIGLIVDTRPIRKSGYIPTSAYIQFEGGLASFSGELPVDEFTHFAILNIPRDSISPEEFALFTGGVKVEITVFDETNNELSKTVENNLTINDSNLAFPVTTDLKKIIPPVKLNPNMHYIIQLKDADGQVLDIPFEETGQVHTTFYTYLGDTMGYNNQYFYFEPVAEGNDSTYYIRAKHSNQYLGLLPQNQNLYQLNVNNPSSLNDSFKFILSPDEEGWVTIKAIDGVPLKLKDQLLFYPTPGQPIPIPETWTMLSKTGDTPAKFRIVAAGITWKYTDLGTEFNNPIMSPAKMDFAYQGVLKNCSPATLMESIGNQDKRESIQTVAVEESFQLSSTHSAGISISASYTASASFYGTGVETSLQASSDYSFTNQMVETTTKAFSATEILDVQVSRIRNLEVPPHTSVQVYDVVQKIENVRIPFVQKIRLEAELENNKLTGDEIVQQLVANRFGGVVTETGAHHVVFTVRGYSLVDQLMQTRTNVEEREGDCN